jgi:hypothetical protein
MVLPLQPAAKGYSYPTFALSALLISATNPSNKTKIENMPRSENIDLINVI